MKISIEFYAVMARAVISRQLIELRIELQISFMPSAWSPNPQSRSWRNHKGLPSTVDGGPTLSVLAKLHDDRFDIITGEALKNAPVVTFLI